MMNVKRGVRYVLNREQSHNFLKITSVPRDLILLPNAKPEISPVKLVSGDRKEPLYSYEERRLGTDDLCR